jgi:hypothetical protein
VSYLTLGRVNSWLASTKYTEDIVEPDLEQQVADIAFGQLSARYDTSVWIDEVTTPSLVNTAMSMLYAAWFYLRQVGDDSDMADYGYKLEERALALLAGISNETIDIPGVDPNPELAVGGSPGFFPTDASTQLWIDDPTDVDGTPVYFSMQETF